MSSALLDSSAPCIPGVLGPARGGRWREPWPLLPEKPQPGAVNTGPGRWDDEGRTDNGAGPRKTPERSIQLQQERLEGDCSSDGADVSSSADNGGHHGSPHPHGPQCPFSSWGAWAAAGSKVSLFSLCAFLAEGNLLPQGYLSFWRQPTSSD